MVCPQNVSFPQGLLGFMEELVCLCFLFLGRGWVFFGGVLFGFFIVVGWEFLVLLVGWSVFVLFNFKKHQWMHHHCCGAWAASTAAENFTKIEMYWLNMTEWNGLCTTEESKPHRVSPQWGIYSRRPQFWGAAEGISSVNLCTFSKSALPLTPGGVEPWSSQSWFAHSGV